MQNDMSYIKCSLARIGWCDECEECVADDYKHLFIEMAEFYDGLHKAGYDGLQETGHDGL